MRTLGSPRSAQVLRAVWGAVCLAVPTGVVRGLGQPPPDPRTVFVIRVLGVRHVVQGTVSAFIPNAHVLAWGASVDGLHSTSMVALGLVDPRRRRLAWTDAVIAAAWGAVTFRGSHEVSASANLGGRE